MTLWLDNQLPPTLTAWVGANLGVDCTSVRALALQRATDLEIFQTARGAGATAWAPVREMLERGAPPVEIGDRPRQR